MTGIALSKKHGVNPSVTKCFWCGKETGVALFGRIPRHRAEKMFGTDFVKHHERDPEVEAPRSVVLDMDPCEGCEVWAHSKEVVFFVEAEESGGESRPTGRFTCVREEAVRRMLDPGELLDDALERRILLMHPEDFKAIFPSN